MRLKVDFNITDNNIIDESSASQNKKRLYFGLSKYICYQIQSQLLMVLVVGMIV